MAAPIQGEGHLPPPRYEVSFWREARASEEDCAVDKVATACRQEERERPEVPEEYRRTPA